MPGEVDTRSAPASRVTGEGAGRAALAPRMQNGFVRQCVGVACSVSVTLALTLSHDRMWERGPEKRLPLTQAERPYSSTRGAKAGSCFIRGRIFSAVSRRQRSALDSGKPPWLNPNRKWSL